MADTQEQPKKLGEHIDIPTHVAANITVSRDANGRALWVNGGGVVVFLMAAVLPIVPLVLLVLLFRQPDTAAAGLSWLWITMAVITGLIAFMVANGLIRSVLEAER